MPLKCVEFGNMSNNDMKRCSSGAHVLIKETHRKILSHALIYTQIKCFEITYRITDSYTA